MPTLQELRHTLRALMRTPSFALVTILSLAIGIGVTATVFVWLNGLVLDPLPQVRDARALVAVRTATVDGNTQSISYPDYLDWSAQTRSLSTLVAHRQERLTLGSIGEQQVWAVFASANYFDALGLRPALGRFFLSSESAPEAAPGTGRVVVLGHHVWRRDFGGRRDVVGSTIRLNGERFTVIGVAPAGFSGTTVGYRSDLWVPITMHATLAGQPVDRYGWRPVRWMQAFGRLAPNATVEDAAIELRAIGQRLESNPENKGLFPRPQTMFETGTPATVKPVMAALFGGSAVLLLIVCANVASLLLVRGIARQREIALRLALGASRTRVMRDTMLEAVVISALGAVGAVVLAQVTSRLLFGLLPTTAQPYAPPPGVGGRVLLFGLVVATGVALLVGMLPALRAARTESTAALRGGAKGVQRPQGRASAVLVIAQLALALVATASAGLFLRSLESLREVDPGFTAPGQVLVAGTEIAPARYTSRTAIQTTNELLDRVRTLPRVRSAAVATDLPLGFNAGFDGFDVRVEGYEPRPDETMSFSANMVSPGYFATLGLPLFAGRDFAAGDAASSPSVAIVSEEFARRFSPADAGRGMIGRRMFLGGRWVSVVGIARDAKYRSLSEPPTPFLYLAFAQWGPPSFSVILRTHDDPALHVPALREALHGVSAALSAPRIERLADRVDGALLVQRISAGLFTGLAGLALALAALGLYGLLSYLVARRRLEIGIRMALGARAEDVVANLLRYVGVLTVAGVAIGVGAALATGRLVESQLFGVEAGDPVTLAVAALVLGVVALVAAALPARRASRVDPAVAMRME